MSESLPKTSLVVGAQGLLGSYITDALKNRGWNVLRGGRRSEDAGDFRYIDVKDETTYADALVGVDVIVSTIEDHDLTLEKFILKNGGALVNPSTLTKPCRERIKDYGRNNDTKGVVISSGGMMGIGCLVIKDLLVKYPDATSIEQGWVFSVAGDLGNSGSTFVQRCLAGQRHTLTRMFELGERGGRKRLLKLDAATEGLVSEEQVGDVRLVYYIGLDESLPNKLINLLNTLRLLPSIPLSVFASGVKKEDDTAGPSREKVAFKTEVTKANGNIVNHKVYYDGDYYSSAVVSALFAEQLVKVLDSGNIKPGGYAPEEVFVLEQFLDELEKEHIYIID